MKIKAIKYIGFYDVAQNGEENRGYSLAAITKMNYICDVLNKIGYEVLIISPSRTKNNRFYNGKTIQINKHTSLKLFPTFPWGNKLQKAFSLVASDIMLFWYLLTQVKRNEAIMVYHSLGLRGIVRFAKKVRGFKVVLEVEEIYQDVMSYSKYTMKNEYKTIAIADKYIFPTELLNEKLNISNKPYTIIYGTYKVEEHRNYKFEDDKIHVVYAGTFDPRKGGALAAAAAAEFLSEKYYVHIIGFGSNKQVEDIEKIINKVSERSKATITYDGLLKGKQYIDFLQKCHIGLSTQDPDADYNNTSFPSKILSYMANGLRVVTVRIKAIESSAIGDEVYYYDKQDPSEIAKAIMSVNLSNEYDSRRIIKELDERFRAEIIKLLS